MPSVHPRRAFAAFAACAVFAAALLLLGGGSDPVLAAQVVDVTSCGGVGSPNCTNLPANVTIGANSCTVLGACDDLGDGVTIGSGSCNLQDACDGAGLDTAFDGSASIGDRSCNGPSACASAGGASPSRAGSASIGNDACDGGSDACRSIGQGGEAHVGDRSCTAGGACLDAGVDGYAQIGHDSCAGSGSCQDLGHSGDGRVGDGSCLGGSACSSAGLSNTDDPEYPGDIATAVIGDSSCNGNSACFMYYGDQVIGNNACNGDFACELAGSTDTTTNATAAVGDNSCNADGACSEIGYEGTGSVGFSSCNQDGQYNAQCNGNGVDVGDCEYNDSLACTTVTVRKDFSDHSAGTVDVKLACASAVDVVADGSEELGDGDSVTYSVVFVGDSVTCEVSESATDGYSSAVSCGGLGRAEASKLEFEVDAGAEADCTFTNSPAEVDLNEATITVRKVFSDHSSATVTVKLVCTDADSVDADGLEELGDDDTVTYTVTFEGDSVSCEVTESGAAAYDSSTSCGDQGSADEGSLEFTVADGVTVDCTFTNSPADVDLSEATVTVRKVFSNHSSGTVEVDLVCADAESVSAGGLEELGDDDTVTYTVTFEGESVGCEVSESGTLGYNSSTMCGNHSAAGASLEFTLAASAEVTCTFTNTPNVVLPSVATVIVRKDFTDDARRTVDVSLVCASPAAVVVGGSQELGDGDSVTYSVMFVGDSAACALSESGALGYTSTTKCGATEAVPGGSVALTLTPASTLECVFTNSPIPVVPIEPSTGSVTVRKVFTDHSRATVEVHLACDGAEVSADSSQRLGDGGSVSYDVTFEGASVRCEVSESGGEGYYSSTACTGAGVVRRGSLAFDLEAGASVQCTFTNSPVDSGDEWGGGGHGGGNGNGTSNGTTCTNGILTGTRPPATGGFGTFAFCGGTFEALLAASGCPHATSVFFYNKPDGSFAAWVPGAEVVVANEAILALFAGTPPIPSGTIFTARCV